MRCPPPEDTLKRGGEKNLSPKTFFKEHVFFLTKWGNTQSPGPQSLTPGKPLPQACTFKKEPVLK